VELASLPSVTIQVMPFRAGAHPAIDSRFAILEFRKREVANVVHVEGLVGQIFLEQPADLQRYRRAFEQLRALACSPDESLEIISQHI